MGQKLSKPEPGKKIKTYLSSLCTGITQGLEVATPKQLSHLNESHQPLKKRHRLTLHLDHALIKLSRKNLTSEQSPTQFSISLQIENHISSRIASFSVILLEGIFTEPFVHSLPYAIKSLRSNRTSFAPMSEGVLAGRKNMGLRKGAVDCMVVSQTSNGVRLLEWILGAYGGIIDSFVLVVEQQMQANDYHQVFIKYGTSFMFQVQKVMLVNKCLANIIYVSTSLTFLRIDQQALALYLAEKMATLDPLLDKPCLSSLVNGFLSVGLALQTINTTSQMVLSPAGIRYDEQFIYRMEQYPGAKSMIDLYWEECKSSSRIRTESTLPKFHQNTPQFLMLIENMESFEANNEMKMSSRRRVVDISFGMKVPKQSGDVI